MRAAHQPGGAACSVPTGVRPAPVTRMPAQRGLSPLRPTQPILPRPAREPCRPHAEKYAADQDAFFADYVESHLKLSELG